MARTVFLAAAAASMVASAISAPAVGLRGRALQAPSILPGFPYMYQHCADMTTFLKYECAYYAPWQEFCNNVDMLGLPPPSFSATASPSTGAPASASASGSPTPSATLTPLPSMWSVPTAYPQPCINNWNMFMALCPEYSENLFGTTWDQGVLLTFCQQWPDRACTRSPTPSTTSTASLTSTSSASVSPTGSTTSTYSATVTATPAWPSASSFPSYVPPYIDDSGGFGECDGGMC